MAHQAGEVSEGTLAHKPQFWKTHSPKNRAPDWCGIAGVVLLIDKCIKFAWMIAGITRVWRLAQYHGGKFIRLELNSIWSKTTSFITAGFGESFSNLSAVVLIIKHARRSNRNNRREPGFDSLEWQPCLAFLSQTVYNS